MNMLNVQQAKKPDLESLPPPERGARISVRNVRHGFFHGEAYIRALWDVSLEVAPSQLLAIVGPSGCGKTTLINMVGGMIQPSAGTVEVDGSPARAAQRTTAYMLARDALLPWRSVRQNVELGLEVMRLPAAERRRRSLEWLERVGLSQFAESRIDALSHGMRQRVAIARTLVQQPRCLLMDEPFGALDAQIRAVQQQEFIALWERERPTVVFITHDLREAILLADRVVLMSARPGVIVEDITIDLPRPRHIQELEHDKRFLGYHDLLYSRLSAEVQRAQELETQ